jgi:hypothetical protein
MMILGKLVALQPALAFAPDALGRVAAARAAKDLGKPLADLGKGDGWRPFFSPAAPRTPGTRLLSGKA